MIKIAGDINLTDWDFNFGFGVGSKLSQGFNPFSRLYRDESDIWIGNFEGVASDATERNGSSARIFRVPPSALRKLKHFDIYGFANNHAMQHGETAYKQTVTALEKFGSCVFGTNEQRTTIIEHQGRKISLTGASFRVDEFTLNPCYWHTPEYKEIQEELDSLPGDAYKVFFVHWGNEYINRPSSQQKKIAHWLIDAGFDLIVGMHPHVLQGFEDYREKRIYYSLGNFVFDMAWEPCRYGALITVDLANGVPSLKNEYVYIDKDGSPIVVSENVVPYCYRFSYLNEELKKEDNLEVYHEELNRFYMAYRKANRRNVIKNIMAHPSFGVHVLKDFVRRRVIHKNEY